jgi:predicted DNA-binding antitoxin AbrB/MazE fold protein
MERTISVIYEDGVFKPLEPVTLEEGVKGVTTIQVEVEATAPKKRVMGLHPGSIWMSDDFDDPLPDAFWVGEE